MNVRLGPSDPKPLWPSIDFRATISTRGHGLEGSPSGKAGLNGPNLVNINEVPANRTLLFDLRRKHSWARG